MAVLDGTEVDVGIRPEHIRVGSNGQFQAPVRLVEQLGPESLAFIDVGDISICCRTFSRPDVKAGDSVSVGFDPGSVHLFDKRSGSRLSH